MEGRRPRYGRHRGSGSAIADATRPDIPTATPDETLGAARTRSLPGQRDEVIVVDIDGVVFGRLRGAASDNVTDQPVGAVMEIGPAAVRPDGSLRSLLGRLERGDTRLGIVNDPHGVVVA